MKHFLFFLLIIPLVRADVILTEIMSNPIADEHLNEWVEIYNNNSFQVNLENFTISDQKDTDIIEGGLYNKKGTILKPYSFAVLTDDKTRVYNNFDIPNNALMLYVDDSSIASGLKNTGGSLIFNNLTYSYPKTRDGYSFSLINSSWQQTIPTPGSGNYKMDHCDWEITIQSNSSIFTDQPFLILNIKKLFGSKTNLTFQKKIYDAQSNKVKDYKITMIKNALDHRTYHYSPILPKEHTYILRANISANCDTNPDNDFLEFPFLVSDSSLVKESFIHILSIENHTEWSSNLKIKLNIYKGNTNKYSIRISLANLTSTTINLKSKYINQTILTDLQVPEGCGNMTSSLVITGLNNSLERQIFIKGNPCKPTETFLTKSVPALVYESENIMIKRLAVFFFAGLLTLISISLLIKND